ncbi:PTS sugar transporter subunit IIA [Pantoea rodasii]|uniref:PTS sugar transporter subunit IIA n=1 Tax=Pantoea rodasii TaxID=1076549 RepID=UPI000FFC3876|nr:PTS sugar transporter subunit IIA [Pantoea rodasii]
MREFSKNLFLMRMDGSIVFINVLASVSVAFSDEEVVEQLMQAGTREALYRLMVNNTGV